MKNPNGYGSVFKFSGKRRKPWAAVITVGIMADENDRVFQKRKLIGTFATRPEALDALARFHESPYDIDSKKITFKEVYDKWSAEYFERIVPSASRSVKSAYTRFAPIYNIPFADLRVSHLEGVIKDCDASDNIRCRMKSVLNLMYKYALKHEIVEVDYAARCDSIKKPKPKIERVPFNYAEIKKISDNLDIPFADMVLIGIYSGWRPQELAVLKLEDVDLDNRTFTGGLKTDAGRNRLVPIHSQIFKLVKKRYQQSSKCGSETLFSDPDGSPLTYDKYRNRFNKAMSALKFKHRPHDTRHTFVTLAKEADVNEYILKLIVGHAIDDITERVYTHRTIEDMRNEIEKIQ